MRKWFWVAAVLVASCNARGGDPTDSDVDAGGGATDTTSSDDSDPSTDTPDTDTTPDTDAATSDTDPSEDADDTDVVDTDPPPPFPMGGWNTITADRRTVELTFRADGTWEVFHVTAQELEDMFNGEGPSIIGCEISGTYTVTAYNDGTWTVDLGHAQVDITATEWTYGDATFRRCDRGACDYTRIQAAGTCTTPTPWVP